MAYDYIARAYGKTFKPGQRVTFSEYGNKPGVVKRVVGDPQYVTVIFDDGKSGQCHPESLTITAEPSGQ